MQLKRKVVLLLLAVMALAAPAVAHVPRRELAPAIDLLHAPAVDQEPERSFRIVPRHLFDEVAHVELPRESISRALERRLAIGGPSGDSRHLRFFTRSASQNLTSGLRSSLQRAIIKEISGLGPETRWAEGYGRNRWYDPERGSWMSPDPVGNRDSANLYSFAAGDPVNRRDPTGLLCETSNASGFWNWVGRCTQDAMSVQQEFNRGVVSLKTPGRAVAGVVGTAKMIGKTAVGIGAMVIDQQLAQAGDVNAMVRQGQRVTGIANAVRHPINTVVDAHTQAAESILAAEQNGQWFRASIEAGEIGSADAAAVVGAAETGVGLVRLGGRLVTRAAAAETAIRWTPVNGPGPLGESVATTFRSASYTETVLGEQTTLYRGPGVSVERRRIVLIRGQCRETALAPDALVPKQAHEIRKKLKRPIVSVVWKRTEQYRKGLSSEQKNTPEHRQRTRENR